MVKMRLNGVCLLGFLGLALSGCGGGAASSSAVCPTALKTVTYKPADMLIDDNYLYWLSGDSTTGVERISLSNPDVVTDLVKDSTSAFAFELAQDASHIYWGNYYGADGIYRVAKTGGSAEAIITTAANVSSLDVNSNSVFSVEGSHDSIHKHLISGGDSTLQTYPSSQGLLFEVKANEDYVVWNPKGSLVSYNLSSTALTTLAGSSVEILANAFALDTTNAYYSATATDIAAHPELTGVFSVPLAGGTPVRISEKNVSYMTVRAGKLYLYSMIAFGSGIQVVSMDTNGANSKTLISCDSGSTAIGISANSTQIFINSEATSGGAFLGVTF